jgi:hypothetical protein
VIHSFILIHLLIYLSIVSF